MAQAGAGIPFCEEVTARVAEFMSQYEGQMPPSERHGGTAVVGSIGEIPDGMNGHISQDYTASQHQRFVNLMTLVKYEVVLLRRWSYFVGQSEGDLKVDSDGLQSPRGPA